MDLSWYTVGVFALGVAATVWLLALVGYEAIGERFPVRTDADVAATYAGTLGTATKRYALPGGSLVLGLGIWLVLASDSISLEGDWWVGACLGLWIVAFVGSTLTRAPECGNIVRLSRAEDVDEEDVRWRTRRLRLLARGETLLLVVGIVLAVVQPA
jgi:hypothetical protein